MHAPDICSALILAGGKATRFGGIAKHALVIEGETIFARQVKVLAPRVHEILVSGAQIEGYRTVTDATAGIGPIAGIAAGLAACPTDWLLVLAGDMPYVTGELVDDMLALATDDAVGVRSNGLPEPLVCVLHRRVVSVADRLIAAGRYKVADLITDKELRVRWLEDIDPRVVANLNTPDDLPRGK